MVQQTIDSKFNEYGLPTAETVPSCEKPPSVSASTIKETGLLGCEKPPLVSASAIKTAMGDSQNETTVVVSKSAGNHVCAKENDSTGEAARVSGAKRPTPDCLVSPSRQNCPGSNSRHLVYVRRKTETELCKTTARDSQLGAQSVDSRKSDQDDTTEEETKTKESRMSSVCPPLASPSLEGPNNISTLDVLPITSSGSFPDNSKKVNLDHFEERFCRLQNLLKSLDDPKQDDYARMLRSLSSVELSRHAFELEKRTIQLLLEEAREMQRVRALDILQKYSKKSRETSTQQVLLQK